MIEARGEDAQSFLQGQVSQDLSDLAEPGAWTLVLAPDSVVITAALATRHDEGIDLVVQRELADTTSARLRRFLLRTKCTITVRDAESGPFATLDELIDARWPGANEFAAVTHAALLRAALRRRHHFLSKGMFYGPRARGAARRARFERAVALRPRRLVRAVEAINAALRSKGPDGPQGLTSATEREGRIEGLAVAHRTLVGC